MTYTKKVGVVRPQTGLKDYTEPMRWYNPEAREKRDVKRKIAKKSRAVNRKTGLYRKRGR